MWSLSTRSVTQGLIAQTRLLLANHDSRCNQICTKVLNLSNPRRLHTSTSGATSPDYCFVTIRGVGNQYRGPISPSLTKGHRFILAITDYFSKWTEVISLIEVKIFNMINFIKHHVIHQFGVPRRIIHDNGP